MSNEDIIQMLRRSFIKRGISGRIMQAGIISVVSTETGFKLREESSYRNTPVQRLRQIFPHKLEKFSDKELDILKLQDVEFFDVIYGGEQGNNQVGDGFKYRGRGYNQITFKNNYARYGLLIGKDLVNKPELMMDPQTASDALAAFFLDGIKAKVLRVTDSLPEATKMAFQWNAGSNTNLETPFFQDEYKRQLANVDSIYKMLV